MPGVFKIKNLQDAEFTLTHPDGVGAVGIDSNNIAKSDVVNAALALKANTANLKEIGVGQTWQDVTGSRVAGVTYTNSTGKPIELSITCNTHSSQAFHISCNGAVVVTRQGSGQYSTPSSMGIVVPVGATYIVDVASTGISRWSELR